MLDPTRALGLLKAGLDNLDQGLTVFNADLKLLFANRRFFELLDLPREIFPPGADFADVIRYNVRRGEYGPGDPDEQIRERVALAREFRQHELERERPNGVVLRVSGAPLPEGGFATIYTDITAQRRREVGLQKRVLEMTEDLRQNEERLRLIANGVPAGIAYLDESQVFQYANLRFARAYGLSPEEIVGRPVRDVLSARTYADSIPYFEQAMQGQIVDFDLEIPLRHGVFVVRTILRPDPAGAEGGRGFYVLSVNVTEQKRAAMALAQAQKMEALGQLSSGIAHDFNNLLTVVLGALTEIELKTPEGDEKSEFVAAALRAARRGADLTGRLLAVGRSQTLSPAPVDLAESLRAVARLVRPSLPEGARIDVEAEEGQAWAFVDPARAEASFMNLAVNARDAVRPGGRIRARLRALELNAPEAATEGLAPGRYVALDFRDDGVGMPAAVRDRCFDPFYTTKPEGRGTGLGLAMAHGFVTGSGGAMRLESSPGAGARFEILLPACDPATGGAATGETAEDCARKAVLQGELALLVDDDEEVRAALRRDLASFGMRVVEAASAEEALAIASATDEIAIVLTDFVMPGGGSGLELAAQLSTREGAPPVVLMTAQTLRQGPGVARAIQKPMERAALGRILALTLCEARAAKREREA